MTECNFHETHNIYQNSNAIPLNDQQQSILNKINEIKDYFVSEIKKRELISKRISKYIASFDYFNKALIVLSVTTDSISNGAPVGIVSASFILAFSIFTGIVKKTVKNIKKQKEKV